MKKELSLIYRRPHKVSGRLSVPLLGALCFLGLTCCKPSDLPTSITAETLIEGGANFGQGKTVQVPNVLFLYANWQPKDSYGPADIAPVLPVGEVLREEGLVDIKISAAAAGSLHIPSSYGAIEGYQAALAVEVTSKGRDQSSDWEKSPWITQKESASYIASGQSGVFALRKMELTQLVPASPSGLERRGYDVTIARRAFIELGKQSKIDSDHATLNFTWKWESTDSGQGFDVSSEQFQRLARPTADQVRKMKEKFDSSKTYKSVCVIKKVNHEWFFDHFESLSDSNAQQ